MDTHDFAVARINHELLLEELQAALPNVNTAVSTGNRLTVFFAKAPSAADIQAIEAALRAHDPDRLTKAQAEAQSVAALLDGLDGPALLAQIDAITSLAGARAMLRHLARLLLRLARAVGRAVKLDEG